MNQSFLAIAEPTRRKILELLSIKENMTAGEIYSEFSSTPPAISQHLKVLRDSGLVVVEKRAQQRIYRINPTPFQEMEKWAKGFCHSTKERDVAKKAADATQGSTDILEPLLPFFS